MSRGKTTDHRKLMEWQAPEASSGPILGILATTYELDPAFVETDLLPAILGLGAWDDKSWASRVALERELSRLEATSILVDQRRYQGRPRSLHVEVLPAVGTGGQKLHAKLTLVVHENAIRLQVSSANLTECGYRENREVALPLLASSAAPEVAALLLQAVEAMPDVLASWWTPSASVVRKLAVDKLRAWSGGAAREAEFVWGGAGKPLWKQVLDGWTVGEPIERISIVSPFWSEEGTRGPFTILLGELRKRELLARSVDIDLYTGAEPSGTGKYRPKLPPLGPLNLKALGARLTARAVQPNAGEVLKPRMLHAKVLLLHGVKNTLAYIGSANFTVSGWGFGGSPTRAHVEAGIVLVRRGAELATTLLPPTIGDPVELDGTNTAGFPPPAETEWTVPTFVKGIWLEPDPLKEELLRLLIQIDPRRVKGAFEISNAGQPSLVLVQGDVGCAAKIRLALEPDGVERLLREPQVSIRWWEADTPSCYPVNVEMTARAKLPAVPGSANPGEQLLLAYYQGKISATDLFPPPSGWMDPETGTAQSPDNEVDTSRIQSYQVREFVEALQGIRDDLTAASKSTAAAMRLAVMGPVSPVALANQVRDAASSGRRGATAAGFQLVEIATCLKEATEVKGTKPAWLTSLEEGRSKVEKMLAELAIACPAELGPNTSFSRYAREVLGWRAKGGQEA